MQPLDRVEDRVLRHRHTRSASEHRLQRLDDPPLDGQHAGHVPAERLGQGEQPQGLGGGGAVDDQHVPLPRPRLCADLEERQHLLGAGDDGELLGRDGVDAGDVEHAQEVALDVAPRLLEPLLRVDVLHPQVGRDLGGLPRGGHRQGVGERVGGIGRQHERPVPGRRGGTRGGRGERRLPDAALAGEEEDPHPGPGCQSDSTRFLRPFSAVSMRIFSPLRLSMPISGMLTSRARR